MMTVQPTSHKAHGLVHPEQARLHQKVSDKAAGYFDKKKIKFVRRGRFMSRRKVFAQQCWTMAKWPNGDLLILLVDGTLMFATGEMAYEVTVPFEALRRTFAAHVRVSWWKVNR